MDKMEFKNNNTSLSMNRDRIGQMDHYGNREDTKNSYDSLYEDEYIHQTN